MERTLIKDIEKEARENALQYQQYHNYLELDNKRNQRRIINAPKKIVKTPSVWSEDKKYNPFYVLKRKEQIAKSISKKLLSRTYKPAKPITKEVKKKGGGTRTVSVYQIPDQAVYDRFYYNLLSKNKHRFSSLSYAYRNDRNVHYAIQDIAQELSNNPRIYVAEFDFSDFFGSINHDYLLNQLTQNSFLVSDLELDVINAFLEPYDKGIPLGTSISLFLANVACWNLDRKFEDAGIRFARYADDTIIWSRHYSKISTAFDIIMDFSKETGIKLNYQKSDGISLLQKTGLKSEFHNSKDFIEFLGYKISCDNVGIKRKSIEKIKKQISFLLYVNLIHPVKSYPFKAMNLPANNMDKDFITAIMQIRHYLYGNMTEITLKKYLNGTYNQLSFKGIMSFYPLVSDENQMLYMDRWLLSTILNVLRKRRKLISKHLPQFNDKQFPFDCKKSELITQCRKKEVSGKPGLIEIPSFMRIYKALKKGLVIEGIEKVMNPASSSYYNE